jgi:hypothetical protein
LLDQGLGAQEIARAVVEAVAGAVSEMDQQTLPQ